MRRALLFAWVSMLAPRGASAVRYELFIDVRTEEDLYDLLATGQISESSFDALLSLHQTKVELNRAGRERLYLLPNLNYPDVDRLLAYRGEAGTIRSIEELVASEVLEGRVAEALRAFVSIRAPEPANRQVDGFARVQGRWTGLHDRLPPATALQARTQALGRLDTGVVAILTRNQVRRVRWDGSRGALSVEPERVRLEVPKAYVSWDGGAWEIVGGTYRIGFAQRLTFDVTQQITPNGFFGDYELRRRNDLVLRCRRSAGELRVSPCPSEHVARVAPDFDWTNRLTGIAIGTKHETRGGGLLQAYAWGSYQLHRVQQNEVLVRARCHDPRHDDVPECAAPRVYVRGSDPRAPSSQASFAALPMAVGEGLAGAHVSYYWHRRAHFGITGYGSVPRWRIDGVELDFQESARTPFGGAFGAVGLSGAYGFRRQDFFVELARSFDSQAGGGGGFGLLARSVTNLAAGELDVSARVYDLRYANPYARPISAPDELDGLRARDEAGLRVRTALELNPTVSLLVLADGWRALSSASPRAVFFARTDFHFASGWTAALWAEYRSTSASMLVGGKVSIDPARRLTLSWQLQHRWRFRRPDGARPQQDVAVIASLVGSPVDRMRMRLRARYDIEDVHDNHRLPHTLWLHTEINLRLRENDSLRARYDLRFFFDERESTSRRVPNPEHWIWLEYVFRY